MGRWGALQGGLGVCIIVASTAVGAIVTMVAGTMPGGLLGLFVVIGAIAAALAVRPSAGRMILPVPVLSYLVAALVSGVIYNRGAGSSNTALAIGAAQWIANGFFPMAVATMAAIVIIVIRWSWGAVIATSPPARPGPCPPTARSAGRPRPPVSQDARADSGYPASRRDPGGAWDSGSIQDSRDGGSSRDGGNTPGWNAPASPGPSDPGLPGYRRPGRGRHDDSGLSPRGYESTPRIASSGEPRSGRGASGRVRHGGRWLCARRDAAGRPGLCPPRWPSWRVRGWPS